MTVLQLRIAVATAELKSVTAAAKLLNTSQPNASNSLKLLEEELGFPVFLRTGGGAVVTEKGVRFLEYARQVLNVGEKITNLKYEEEVYRLRLGTVNYYAAAEPFFTLCAEHRDDAKTDFRYSSVNISEGIQAVARHELDIVAAPVLQHQIAGLSRECRSWGVEMNSVCHIPSMIIVRKGHPAALDGRCSKITQGCDTMKEYPYISLRRLAEETGATAYNDSDFIQCSYTLFADDTNIRLRMIESTNGFGFGLPSSYKMMKMFDLELFPVRDVSLELLCLTRPGETLRREIRDYMLLLKKEMLRIFG